MYQLVIRWNFGMSIINKPSDKNLKSYNETNTTLVDLRHDRAKNFTLSDTLIEQINSALKIVAKYFYI